MRRTPAEAEPLAEDLAAHTMLLVARSNAVGYRQLAALYAESGIALEMPYLDDAVLDTVLRVPVHEHAGPWRYKPLLADAVRGVVPEELRTRSTKGEFGEDVRVGLRRNQPELVETLADSQLVQRGLVDADILRARLAAPHADHTLLQALENLLGCETWLRTTTVPPATRHTTAPWKV